MIKSLAECSDSDGYFRLFASTIDNASYIVRKLGRTGTPLFLLTKGITLSNVSNKGSSSNCLIDKAILDFSLFYFVNAKYVQLFHMNHIHDKADKKMMLC